MPKANSSKQTDGANLNFVARLWAAAYKMQMFVSMLEPYKGGVFDPCCVSGEMFVSLEKLREECGRRVGEVAFCGQESNYTTWKLARMKPSEVQNKQTNDFVC